MRECERDPLRIEHILEAAHKINRFMDGKTLDDINKDEILFFAVVKNIEIIGEAAFMLTNEFKEKHPHIPWRQIVGMRHVLVHDYFRISPIEVYKVYSENLPVLIPQIEALDI